MTASNMGNGPDKNFNAKEERKLRKPLIEKRRRERINCSLEQLKGIMVDAYNLDQSKLEKADVLEITVQHMEGLQKGHGPGSPAGPGRVGPGFESRQRYSSGYIQCMHEVHNLLLTCPGMDKPLGARLLNHLLKSLPHVGADAGSPNVAANTAGGVGSPLSGSGPVSPPHSPLLSLSPSRASFRPRRLLLQPPPPHPSSPSAPPASPPPRGAAPGVLVTDGRGARERLLTSPPSSPTPFSSPGLPRPGAPAALPTPPPIIPGGDPSMWRPW